MICDSYWTNVVLLLTFDGTNGATAITDTSTVGNAMTHNVGTGTGPVLSTTAPMFGTACAYSNASTAGGSWSTPVSHSSPLDLSVCGSFTIEGWLYAAAGASGTLFSSGVLGANSVSILLDGSAGYVSATVFTPSDTQIYSSTSFVANTWLHFALVYNSVAGNYTLYLNGIGGTPVSGGAPTYAGSSQYVYAGGYFAGGNLTGYIDEFRVTTGVARYTANFTPPTVAFGGACISVPNVVADTLATAETAITTATLTVGAVTYQNSATIAFGAVISTTPAAGTPVDSGTAVNLVDSLGPTPPAPSPTGNTSPPFLIVDEVITGAQIGRVLNLIEFTYFPTRPEDTSLDLGPNMIINRYKQQPTDVRQRGVDFTQFLLPGELVTGVALNGILTEAAIPPTPLSINNILLDPLGMKFAYTAAGGQDGYEYQVQFRVTTTIQTVTTEEIFSINIMIQDEFP